MLRALPILLFFLFYALAMIVWIWMLVECATKEPTGHPNKIVWIIIIVFTHFIGAILYYYARHPKRTRETGG